MNRMIRHRLRDLADAFFLQARDLSNMGMKTEAGDLRRRAGAFHELALMSAPLERAAIPVRARRR